jgi:hypothetical protein
MILALTDVQSWMIAIGVVVIAVVAVMRYLLGR